MILIGLGANLHSVMGSPAQTLRAALLELEKRGVKIVGTSDFYQTPAWPDPADPPFTNAVARVHTRLAPQDLLKTLHAVEADFGRLRSTANAPRSLDLDLLDYNSRVETGPPILPHPRMTSRVFVLLPLLDVAPDWVDPGTGKSLPALLADLDVTGVTRCAAQS